MGSAEGAREVTRAQGCSRAEGGCTSQRCTAPRCRVALGRCAVSPEELPSGRCPKVACLLFYLLYYLGEGGVLPFVVFRRNYLFANTCIYSCLSAFSGLLL